MVMKTVGILYSPQVAQAHPLAREMAMWIEQRGRQAQVCTPGDAPGVLCWQETDLLVRLGGDGSILRAARAAAAYSTPILGVNLGRVGFLTEACPETWRDVLSRALVGDYWIEERMMLQAAARRSGEALATCESALAAESGKARRTLARALGGEIASLLNYCAIAQLYLGNAERAVRSWAQAREAYRRAHQAGGEAGVLNNLGKFHMDRGDLQRARPALRQALAQRQKLGDIEKSV